MIESTEKLDVIILAGGLGTRLRKILENVPKPLAPVNGRPFLDIILTDLKKYNYIEKIIIAIGYMADKFIERYKNTSEYNCKIIFSIEEELLGTGGAIKKALKFTETKDLLVLNGDSYINVDLDDLLKKHIETDAVMTIVLRKLRNANRYGRVKLGSNNRIITFEEKQLDPSKGYINAGMYLIKRELFDNVKENTKISLEEELMSGFLERGVYGYVSHGKFIDIGIPETYNAADKYLKDLY